ncbi:MAG: ABC transporter ATP-binding protein [Lachnospiraceae bacterium]|nr:ABC transporter ATP-binding protein [Lachnospiraceae bacterium]
MHIINCRHLTKIYAPDTHALNDVSLKINKGEYISITGKSGSGKSMLLNIIGLLEAPTDGELYVGETLVHNMKESQLTTIRNQEIGYIFQSFFLDGAYSVYKNVEMPLLIAGVKRRERKERVLECLHKVDLLDKIHTQAKNLSGGQQQRVSIARALVNTPNIILADEPCGNLDSQNTENIMKIFDTLHREGKTIILVTHSQEEADRAYRKIQMKDGKIITDETK